MTESEATSDSTRVDLTIELDRPLVVVDVETTGINVQRDRIVQLASIKLLPGGAVRHFVTLINPMVPIPKEASDVHGITDEMVKDKPTFETLARGLAMAFADCDLCGYNIGNFDHKILIAEFDRARQPHSLGKARVVDVFRIWQKIEPRTLIAASEYFLGTKDFQAHDAMADCEVTLQVLGQMLRWYKPDTEDGQPGIPQRVQDLHDMIFGTASNAVDSSGKIIWRGGEACIGFGKHNGTPLRDIPRQYLSWMLSTGDFPQDTMTIIKDALIGTYPVKQ